MLVTQPQLSRHLFRVNSFLRLASCCGRVQIRKMETNLRGQSIFFFFFYPANSPQPSSVEISRPLTPSIRRFQKRKATRHTRADNDGENFTTTTGTKGKKEKKGHQKSREDPGRAGATLRIVVSIYQKNNDASLRVMILPQVGIYNLVVHTPEYPFTELSMSNYVILTLATATTIHHPRFPPQALRVAHGSSGPTRRIRIDHQRNMIHVPSRPCPHTHTDPPPNQNPSFRRTSLSFPPPPPGKLRSD